MSSKKNSNKYGIIEKHKSKSSWFLILFIITFMMSIFYIYYVKDLVYQNVYNNITEISEQTATQLNLAINDQKYFVKIIVDSINRNHFKTIDDIFERYKGDLENFHFTRLVILDENGNGTTSDGVEVKNYSNINEFFNQDKDTVYLSENRPSTVSNNQVNIYSRRFNFYGEEKVLLATVNTENYQDILLRRLFGKGGTYLINGSGTVLIDSFGVIKQNNVNLFNHMRNKYKDKIETNIQAINNMETNIKQKKVGTFDITRDNSTYFIHYEKLKINDWYIITVLSDDTIAKELIRVVIVSSTLCLIVNLLIILASIYINVSNQNKNHRTFKVAFIDQVTSLGNEKYFKEKASKYMQNEVQNKYIISLDINKFKALNSIHGYDFCNKILDKIGEKLVKNLPKESIICRSSADIFNTIFSYQKDIEKLLDKIVEETSNLEIDNLSIHLNLSIGVYKLNKNDKDINQALDKAYMARSKIKGIYDTSYYVFDELLGNKLTEEQELEACMEDALLNNEFEVIYQPKILTKNEKVMGAEALVRWYRKGEIVSPTKFITLFERNKFIMKLDLYIFEKVCKDIVSWKEKYDFIPTISINVSKAHFENENFINEYVKITDKYKINRNQIDLEITESATVDEDINILKILNKIKEKGFIISLDDFGTGYSSLSMLQNMPIDIIKIDKVFIDKANLSSDRNIINSIETLAKRIGVETIVEGVETREQVNFVKRIGCDIIQGYYYSKPISREEFEVFFNKNK
ncbi:MAG: GGDEF domain-containing protein [Clostridia bacterium]|nr:GGDEF domain-containing protein [Clostridia bacterium]